MSQFVDQVRIKVASGEGGNGTIAWRREKYEPLGGPAGGTGGRGGHVYLQATSDLSTLLDFHYKVEFRATPGERGGPKNRHGKDGKDLTIKVPIGTVVTDAETQVTIADLSCEDALVLVAQGGRGGRGNAALATQARRAPHFCEPGELGIERELGLELKLLADVGIVGLPNAGKSSLLAVMTAARPKVADYPFSTLTPNLGVMRRPDGDGIVLADIPGLVSGAAQGVGLGHTFLRHVERTSLLVHMVDITSETIESDITIIDKELSEYEEKLLSMPRILFLNKAELLAPETCQTKLHALENHLSRVLANSDAIIAVMAGSCATRQSISELSNLILERTQNRKNEPMVFLPEDTRATTHPGDTFAISRRRNIFYVSGARVERIVGVTDLRSPESLQHLFHVLRSMGVIDALMAEGIVLGREVVIGKTSFTFGEEFS